MLILKLTNNNRQTRGGFQWPESGPVECPDWSPVPDCDSGRHGGLHGWARGEGNYIHDSNDGVWLVVDVPDDTVIEFGGKCKFPRGNVVYCGTREGAVEYLIAAGTLNSNSNPAWVMLSPDMCAIVANKAAKRTHSAYAAADYAAAAASYAAASAASAASDAEKAELEAELEAQRLDKLSALGIA